MQDDPEQAMRAAMDGYTAVLQRKERLEQRLHEVTEHRNQLQSEVDRLLVQWESDPEADIALASYERERDAKEVEIGRLRKLLEQAESNLSEKNTLRIRATEQAERHRVQKARDELIGTALGLRSQCEELFQNLAAALGNLGKGFDELQALGVSWDQSLIYDWNPQFDLIKAGWTVKNTGWQPALAVQPLIPPEAK